MYEGQEPAEDDIGGNVEQMRLAYEIERVTSRL
jgi:hypothetical protein